MARHILVVDDDPQILASLSADLKARGYRVGLVRDGSSAMRILAEDPPDAVLLDLRLGAENGLDVLERIRQTIESPPPILMISGAGSITEAVESLRRGAIDFIEKPLTGEQVAHRVRRALRDVQLESTCRDLRTRIDAGAGLIGASDAMRKITETIAIVAPTDARVLISGESGTGKELVARAIHDASPRAREAFVAVNCSAIPGDLVESELFGHQRGAFTGATVTRRGCFENATGGTLFLDEIAEMPTLAQPKLLRALEAGQIQRVGADTTIPIDVRVIAATNRDLRSALTAGTFREDLYHRLNVVEIHIPPLRERPEDIDVLCRHFLVQYARRYGRTPISLTADARLALRRHPFSGNVRELRNLMERLTILCLAGSVDASRLQELGGLGSPRSGWTAPPLEEGESPLRQTLRTVERDLVVRTLRENDGKMAETARRLGLERSHLYRKLKELGIERESDGE